MIHTHYISFLSGNIFSIFDIILLVKVRFIKGQMQTILKKSKQVLMSLDKIKYNKYLN